MSKNIVIQEGASTKKFGGVKKLSTVSQEGGTVEWVPEDEANDYADLMDGKFTKNGTYYAAASGVAGFSSVEINVPVDASNIKADNMIESMTTNITAYALTPNIQRSTTSWDWIDGRDNKTFTGNSTQKTRNFISIVSTEGKISYMPLIVPADYTAISENDTALLTNSNGEQIYFKDLNSLAAGGFTTVSPKEYNPQISDLVFDMYKCRRLKGSDAAQDVVKIYGNITTQTINNAETLNFDSGVDFLSDAEINFTKTATEKMLKTTLKDDNGNQYGFVVKMSSNNTPQICIRYNNMDLQAFFGAVVDDLESEVAQALPVGAIAILRR